MTARPIMDQVAPQDASPQDREGMLLALRDLKQE